MKIDFIGIGVEKSGTTWLVNMLKKHPDVFMPEQKELYYFNKEFAHYPNLKNFQYGKPLSWYTSFFKDAKKNQIKGEVSPAYLWSKNAVKDIFNFDPNIKIIVILRDPIEKIFSLYLFYLQLGIISKMNFEQALKKRPDLIERSLYYCSLKKYFDLFPRKNIKVMLFDDLKKDRIEFLKEIERFLDIKEFIPDSVNENSNVTGVPVCSNVNNLIQKTRYFLRKNNLNFLIDAMRMLKLDKLNNAIIIKNRKEFYQKPQIDECSKEKLKSYFRDDINKLEKLIGRDLSQWKI